MNKNCLKTLVAIYLSRISVFKNKHEGTQGSGVIQQQHMRGKWVHKATVHEMSEP